jgi:hypothetical protein
MAQGHAMQVVPPEVRDNLPAVEQVDELSAGQTGRQAATAAPDEGTGNVEKIRDILFGTQMREYESRFARLEENIVKEIHDVREDTRKHFEALEAHLKYEIRSSSATAEERARRADRFIRTGSARRGYAWKCARKKDQRIGR